MAAAHLTIAEAAQRLGISTQAVRQAIREGRLATVTATVPRVMVPVSALRAYQVARGKQVAGRTRPPHRP